MKEGGFPGKTYGEEYKKSRAEFPGDPDTEIREEIRQTLEERGIKEVIRKIGGWTSGWITAEDIFTIIKEVEPDAGEAILKALETSELFAEGFVHDLRKYGEACEKVFGDNWMQTCALILADNEFTAEKFIEVITIMREDPRESGNNEWKDNPWVDEVMGWAEEEVGRFGGTLDTIRERVVKETTLNIVEDALKKKGLKGVVGSIDEWVKKSRSITARDIFEIIVNERDAGEIARLIIEEYCSTETVNAFWEREEATEAPGKKGELAMQMLNYITYLYARKNPTEQGPAWIKKALMAIAQNTDVALKAAIDYKLFHKGASWWDAYGKEEIREVAMESIMKALDEADPKALKKMLHDGDEYEEQQWIEKITRKMAEKPEFAATITTLVKFEGASLRWINEPWAGAVIEKAKETERARVTRNAKKALRTMEKISMYGPSFHSDDEGKIEEAVSEAIQYYAAAEKFIECVEERKIFKREDNPWVERCYEDAKDLRERVAREAREHRDRIVEGEDGYTLSKEEFTGYFEPKIMRQRNVGNCYLVAVIYAMREWPHAEMVLRKSVKRNPDGSWEVRLPFMDAEGETVTVTREDMQPQKNEIFRRKISGENRIDYRETLDPLTGPEGYQALEAAYTKKYFGKVDRIKSEGGQMNTAFKVFGGALFARDKNNSPVSNPGEPILRTVFNPEASDRFLKNFDPEIYIATCACWGFGTIGNLSVNGAVITERGGSESPEVRENKKINIITNHAYAVKGVDKERKEVRIVNPRDTAEVLVVSFEKFKKIFTEVETVRINNEKILEEYKKTDVMYNHEER